MLRGLLIFIDIFYSQEDSGAQITIGKPEPKNPTDRVITIKVQFLLLQHMLQQLFHVTTFAVLCAAT